MERQAFGFPNPIRGGGGENHKTKLLLFEYRFQKHPFGSYYVMGCLDRREFVYACNVRGPMVNKIIVKSIELHLKPEFAKRNMFMRNQSIGNQLGHRCWYSKALMMQSYHAESSNDS